MANYTSDYSFKINGVSSDNYGVFVDVLEPVPHAQQRYTTGFTGSEEPFSIPDDVFEPISYSINFYKFYPDDLNDSAIRAFLANGNTLELSTTPDVYYKILSISVSEVSQTADNRRINYRVAFTLKPFRYGLDNDWIELSSGDTVENVGTWYSKPVIELTGTEGSFTLTCNDVEYKLTNLLATVNVDSSRFIVYDGSNRLLIGHDEGKFPFLNVGDNTISWTGTATRVRIKTNWRYI